MKPKTTQALVRQRANEQVHVNDLFRFEGAEVAEREIRRLVQVENEQRYSGLEWLLGHAIALVEGLGRIVYAKPGDIVLLSQDPAGVVSFYSVRVSHSCIAGAGIRPLMGWDEAFAFWRRQAGKDEAVWIVNPPVEEEDPVISGEIPAPDARSEPEGDIQAEDG